MKKFFITTLYLMLSIAISAQIPSEPKSLLSPNASSLGEYGEVPVSLYTGVPDIKIPLYTIELGEYNLPITMSYHAGGIRPDQHVGWTGLGWTLNAGGCISRVVNYFADEYHIANREGQTNWYFKEFGFYYRHADINFNWEDSVALKNKIQTLYSGTADEPVYFVRDTEPDRFMFNFLDYHGNFYLDTSGNWQVQCNKPVKVVFNDDFSTEYSQQSESFVITDTSVDADGRTHSFKTFTIIGEDGTKYVFGEDENAIEYSMDFFSQNTSPFIAGTWYLTKIIYPNQREVKFTYEREDFIAQFYDLYRIIDVKSASGTNADFSDIYLCRGSSLSGNRTFGGQLLLPTYLSRIDFDSGHIDFSHSKTNDLPYKFDSPNPLQISEEETNGAQYLKDALPILRHNGRYDGEKTYPNCLNGLKWYMLSNIRVENTDKILKKFFFSYNNDTTQRLTLKSIYEVGGEISSPGRMFKFEYYKPETLPDYLSSKTDHWGFYNGRTSSYEMGISAFINSKEANPNIAQTGVLTKIIYPTGGFTKFVYEPHDYQKQVNIYRTGWENLDEKKYAGGLRIKRIVNSPTGLEQDTCTVKQYFYVSDFLKNKENAINSSGVLGQRVEYVLSNHNIMSPNGLTSYAIDMFSNQSVLPFKNNTHGTHIGYSQVVEKLSDGSFSIYRFSNFDNGYCDSRADVTFQGHTIFEPYSSRDQERGLLLSKTDYDNLGQKTNSHTILYQRDLPDSAFVKAINTNIITTICGTYAEATAYRNFLYSMRPFYERDTTFVMGSDPIVSTKRYTYNAQRLIHQLYQTDINGANRRITYKYPTSFIDNTSGRYKDMCNSNRISPIVECIVEDIDKSNSIYPVKKTFYHYDSNIVKPSSIDEAYGSGSYEQVSSFLYDKFYNVYYEKVFGDFNDIWYIWSHTGLYPVAIIEGVNITAITNILGDLNTFSSLKKPDYSKIFELKKSMPYSLFTIYYYSPHIGLTKSVAPNGDATYYEYDYLGRLIDIKDNDDNVIKHFEYNFGH